MLRTKTDTGCAVVRWRNIDENRPLIQSYTHHPILWPVLFITTSCPENGHSYPISLELKEIQQSVCVRVCVFGVMNIVKFTLLAPHQPHYQLRLCATNRTFITVSSCFCSCCDLEWNRVGRSTWKQGHNIIFSNHP